MPELKNWGDIADTAWEAPRKETSTDKPDLERQTVAQKLKNPVTRKVLNAMLAAAVLTGAGAVAVESLKSVGPATEAAEAKIQENNSDKLRSDLIERLSAEGVTEEDIDIVLSDPELMNTYQEMRTENPASFDEYLREKGIEIDD